MKPEIQKGKQKDLFWPVILMLEDEKDEFRE